MTAATTDSETHHPQIDEQVLVLTTVAWQYLQVLATAHVTVRSLAMRQKVESIRMWSRHPYPMQRLIALCHASAGTAAPATQACLWSAVLPLPCKPHEA